MVIDLCGAEWCGPCKTLGPILEKVVDATGRQGHAGEGRHRGEPGSCSQAFKVQSIPAVYAIKDGAVVDGFMGAYPEQAVQQFVDGLLPSEEQEAVTDLIAAGDEASAATRAVDGPLQRGCDRRPQPSSCSSPAIRPRRHWQLLAKHPRVRPHPPKVAASCAGRPGTPDDDYDETAGRPAATR